jgi:hypothetical protein
VAIWAKPEGDGACASRLGTSIPFASDVLCLQEIKRLDEQFPRMEIESRFAARGIGCCAR